MTVNTFEDGGLEVVGLEEVALIGQVVIRADLRRRLAASDVSYVRFFSPD